MARINPIRIHDEDNKKEYILEFNRSAVERAEDNGFSIKDIDRYPSKLSDLWHYAFYMHHSGEFLRRELSRKETDRLLDSLGGIAGLDNAVWERLGELYMQAYESLNGEEKNSKVTVEL